MPRKRRSKAPKRVESFRHDEAKRPNLPSAEHQSVMAVEDQVPIRAAIERRNLDLDPQLVWRGKSCDDELEVQAPPLFIQEKVHPKALIDDLKRLKADGEEPEAQAGLFDDFNGLPSPEARTEFYQHEANWSNRMILGDALQVMASLANREGLRGKVQCIYIDPPYGIKFNSNFQWSTTSRDVKDGKADHITREPEQVKAFRDTWRDGIHSYLSYLRDRLLMARELLTESGSVFVQIGDENVHRVRAVMDEVFGEGNSVNTVVFKKKSATLITESVFDALVWYCKSRDALKVRNLYQERRTPEDEDKFNTLVEEPMVFRRVSGATETAVTRWIEAGARWARVNYPIVSQHPSETRSSDYSFRGLNKSCGVNKQWRFDLDEGLPRIEKAGRIFDGGGRSLGGVVFWDDWNYMALSNIWSDIHGEKFPAYVVQTSSAVLQRCILMTTDPGDLVLDPTCGSGTTAYVAEQWGRRWITIDTSRVALALARGRVMGARYPYYLLADSREGQEKEAEITRTAPKQTATYGRLRQGFVYERVPHITLKAIANNAEIDVIWERLQPRVEGELGRLNGTLRECAVGTDLDPSVRPSVRPFRRRPPEEVPVQSSARAKPVRFRGSRSLWVAAMAKGSTSPQRTEGRSNCRRANRRRGTLCSSGKCHEKRRRTGLMKLTRPWPPSGRPALPGRRRSTLRSPRRPPSSISTTSPTRTGPRSASPVPSASSRYRPTARCSSTRRTTWSTPSAKPARRTEPARTSAA